MVLNVALGKIVEASYKQEEIDASMLRELYPKLYNPYLKMEIFVSKWGGNYQESLPWLYNNFLSYIEL
jgi:hypothetical protein